MEEDDRVRPHQICAALTCAAILAVGSGQAVAQTALGVEEVKPWVGALYPDTPVAQGHNDAAKALAMVDGNPLIRWEYRVWCETGYHHIDNVGTNQFADPLPDPSRDLVSPNGFYYREYRDPMPPGGVQFFDDAWYFGTDYVGTVIVKKDDGLLMFDALTTAEDMQTQVIDQMPAAGLDPADITHIFVGHRHLDHAGGVNLIRREHAPDAIVVAGAPDAEWFASRRAEILDGTAPLPGNLGDNPTEEQIAGARAVLQRQLEQLPESVEIAVPAFEGITTGMQRIDVGGGVEVVVILQPGHTPGQISAIVPVTLDGEEHKLFVWSGNDQLGEARQYAISADFARGIAEQEGADAFINTHPYQSAIFHYLRNLKADPDAENPMLMGVNGVSRFIGIFADCQRAAAQRFEDGTWVSWE